MMKKRIKARNSKVHGRGVFAVKRIPKGSRIVEYKGKRVPWHEFDEADDGHTMLFHVDDDTVIDANQGGSIARWINHSCKPNCEAVFEDGRVFIESVRDIKPGEELGYDYGLQTAGRITKADVLLHRCRCGAKKCRGTMLEIPKKRRKQIRKWIREAIKAEESEARALKAEKKAGKKARRSGRAANASRSRGANRKAA